MSLFDQIKKDMYSAMKSGEKSRVVALRSILSKLKDRQIAKQETLKPEEEFKVLQSLVKQHKESIQMFRRGGREDLAQVEEAEIEVLTGYLPKGLEEEEVRELVQQVIKETGSESMSDIGRVMPEVMKRGQGRIDGKLAQQLVREFLG